MPRVKLGAGLSTAQGRALFAAAAAALFFTAKACPGNGGIFATSPSVAHRAGAARGTRLDPAFRREDGAAMAGPRKVRPAAVKEARPVVTSPAARAAAAPGALVAAALSGALFNKGGTSTLRKRAHGPGASVAEAPVPALCSGAPVRAGARTPIRKRVRLVYFGFFITGNEVACTLRVRGGGRDKRGWLKTPHSPHEVQLTVVLMNAPLLRFMPTLSSLKTLRARGPLRLALTVSHPADA